MKKIKLLGLLLLVLITLTGCKNNNLDNANIYTTVYPLKYITEYLYGSNSTVSSIYPNGVNLDEYELTDKQIDNYANSDLFVYIGLSNEKEIAKTFLNKNHDLLIIDATYGLNNESIKELWLAPNNFLMLAKNIKLSLIEYTNNSLKEEEITKKYDELYEKVSWLDAELRNIAASAKVNGNNTIVIMRNSLKFLENYGFNIISIEDIEKSNSENAKNDLKTKFSKNTYSKILKLSSESNSDLTKDLITLSKAGTSILNDLITNADTASDYISIQYENIAIIRDYLLK